MEAKKPSYFEWVCNNNHGPISPVYTYQSKQKYVKDRLNYSSHACRRAKTYGKQCNDNSDDDVIINSMGKNGKNTKKKWKGVFKHLSSFSLYTFFFTFNVCLAFFSDLSFYLNFF